eukprot:4128204-Amphidinium_carterae.1
MTTSHADGLVPSRAQQLSYSVNSARPNLEKTFTRAVTKSPQPFPSYKERGAWFDKVATMCDVACQLKHRSLEVSGVGPRSQRSLSYAAK